MQKRLTPSLRWRSCRRVAFCPYPRASYSNSIPFPPEIVLDKNIGRGGTWKRIRSVLRGRGIFDEEDGTDVLADFGKME